jgi:hypothetical protein
MDRRSISADCLSAHSDSFSGNPNRVRIVYFGPSLSFYACRTSGRSRASPWSQHARQHNFTDRSARLRDGQRQLGALLRSCCRVIAQQGSIRCQARGLRIGCAEPADRGSMRHGLIAAMEYTPYTQRRQGVKVSYCLLGMSRLEIPRRSVSRIQQRGQGKGIKSVSQKKSASLVGGAFVGRAPHKYSWCCSRERCAHVANSPVPDPQNRS